MGVILLLGLLTIAGSPGLDFGTSFQAQFGFIGLAQYGYEASLHAGG